MEASPAHASTMLGAENLSLFHYYGWGLEVDSYCDSVDQVESSLKTTRYSLRGYLSESVFSSQKNFMTTERVLCIWILATLVMAGALNNDVCLNQTNQN